MIDTDTATNCLLPPNQIDMQWQGTVGFKSGTATFTVAGREYKFVFETLATAFAVREMLLQAHEHSYKQGEECVRKAVRAVIGR